MHVQKSSTWFAALAAFALMFTATLTEAKKPDNPGGGNGGSGGGDDGGADVPVFVFRNDADGGLFLTTIDGSTTTRLTQNDRTSDTAPTWSPDFDTAVPGHQGWIAFFRPHEPGTVWGDLLIVPSDGSGDPVLVRSYTDFEVPPPAGTDYSLSWSPDGSRILYEANGSAWVVKVSTGEVQNLHLPEADTPDFSPDLDPLPGYQGKIAFRFGDDIAAVDVTIDTSDVLSVGAFSWLTDTPAIKENFPDWSPDGQFIAFQRLTIDAPLETNDTGISIMDVTTGSRTDVVETIRSDVRPSWSPDGLDIAYYDARPVGRKGGKFTTDIYYVSPWLPDPPVNVTNTDSTRDLEYVPDWSPALD